MLKLPMLKILKWTTRPTLSELRKARQWPLYFSIQFGVRWLQVLVAMAVAKPVIVSLIGIDRYLHAALFLAKAGTLTMMAAALVTVVVMMGQILDPRDSVFKPHWG